jgi:SpoVK/Ycf46/Vps4 family AAA+-type ATPase
MMCPPYLHGYCPPQKVWGRFYIDQLDEPQWKENAYDYLVLPPAQKRVIRSLVNSHRFPDTVEDSGAKGKGLVVLLHGTPGSGKTLTAETASEHSQRPLLSISSGDLGESTWEIDLTLKEFLRYATIWGAIVLIDEADVFLEARQANGVGSRLEQNSLVASK